jgi:glutamyl-tRNA synthetase
MTVRTRFAPSPTGQLHLGNVRTAIFAWAYARRHGGRFVLRIEDTDLERSTDTFKAGILEDMAWLGLDYDEGPIYQMQRMDRYRAVLGDWLARGLAYRCYMSPAELDALRQQQMTRGEKPRYDGRWRPENAARLGLIPPPGVAPVIRFRNPDRGVVAWQDAVKGPIEISNHELDDLILARPDGTPTYNFCVVVDDVDMRITHVIRGDDHVNNTPRQINLFRALGADLPVFAHTPTVLGPDGEKLSKRHGATSLAQYAQMGYLPQAMVNFLARLGWSHGDDEVFTPQQLAEWFNLESINAAPGRFNADKLAWLNQEHMKRSDPAALAQRLAQFLPGHVPREILPEVALLFRDRAATLVSLAEQARFLFTPPEIDRALLAEHLPPAVRPALTLAQQRLQEIPTWSKATIGAALKSVVSECAIKVPQLMMPIRVAIAGRVNTPSVDAVLALLDRQDATRRLSDALRCLG